MMRLRKALREAKAAGRDSVEVPIEDLERLIKHNQGMDRLLAACMEKLSPEDYQKIFGGMFETSTDECDVPAP
jgi:hypothetical protein